MVQTKLLSDLYPAKFLDISAKPFFPCENKHKFITKNFETLSVSHHILCIFVFQQRKFQRH